jgi:hypothetical protein
VVITDISGTAEENHEEKLGIGDSSAEIRIDYFPKTNHVIHKQNSLNLQLNLP